MDYSIIIINYNLTKEVNNCINSLLNFSADVDFEVILVDNHSADESIIKIAEDFSCIEKLNFTFIRTEKNLGFGNACNLAAKRAKGKFLFFLNPDTVIKENIFTKLDICYSNNSLPDDTGIIGLNVNETSIMDFSAGFFPGYFFELLSLVLINRYVEAFIIKLLVKYSTTKIIKVDWVMGAAIIIKRDLFKMLEGFDPDYFLFYEEMDLCKRVVNKGHTIKYLSDIKVDHIGSAVSKKNYYFFTKMFYKGKLLFLKKHSGSFGFYLHKKLLFLHIIIQMVLWQFMSKKNIEKSSGKLKAFREILDNINCPEKISNMP